jgi:hypothetical protein
MDMSEAITTLMRSISTFTAAWARENAFFKFFVFFSVASGRWWKERFWAGHVANVAGILAHACTAVNSSVIIGLFRTGRIFGLACDAILSLSGQVVNAATAGLINFIGRDAVNSSVYLQAKQTYYFFINQIELLIYQKNIL